MQIRLKHRQSATLIIAADQPLAPSMAPDLVEAIVDGRQPRATTLQALTAAPLPRTWDGQRQLVASFA